MKKQNNELPIQELVRKIRSRTLTLTIQTDEVMGIKFDFNQPELSNTFFALLAWEMGKQMEEDETLQSMIANIIDNVDFTEYPQEEIFCEMQKICANLFAQKAIYDESLNHPQDN